MSGVTDLPLDDGIEAARKIAEEEELGLRRAGGWQRLVVPTIAMCWSLFQLSLSSWLMLDSTYIRAIHLAFALSLIFLSYPALRRDVATPGLRWMGEKHKIPLVDMVLAVVSVLAALYIVFDYEGLASRVGLPISRDLLIGGLLILILLEATRRVMGVALPAIAIAFSCYLFFAPHMPDFMAFKGASVTRFIGQIALTTEGIYGIPLDVSARIVFLFVLFGTLLERAGAGRFFIDLAMSLLGRYKGGPAKAAVLSSGLTGMISGSSIANVVTCGTFTIPLMKKVGYPAEKAAAIEVAAAVDGQIMPPIMGAAAFIIAEYVNVPYLEVCKAAAIPAFASYATLFYLTHIEAGKLGLMGLPKADLPRFFKTLLSGLHFILPVGVLLYELIIPRHSPDLSAFHATLALFLVMLVQHAVRAKFKGGDVVAGFFQGARDIRDGMIAGARNMVGVAAACAAAGIIVGGVTMGIGGMITEIIASLSGGNIFIMLVITAIASLLLGMGLPTTATYIVMASLTAPVIVHIAGAQGFFVPLISAHLFCFYFGILADDTPPVGLAAYAAAAIAKSDPIKTGFQSFYYDIRAAILPFMFIFNTDILLWHINSWTTALVIFAMTCLGTFAFASLTQGYFIARNRWYEMPILIAISAIMFRPGFFAEAMGLGPNKHWLYLIGIGLWILLYLLQKPRADRETAKLLTGTAGA
ncbi:TRAP transporter permease [Geopsychrobacter electrodiphilus]|uniref:TRAP transporter permease n=1 Tax=Geopsychrobacter electrodiphilus TaxID=225196 RepID=UPI00037536D7|nr:TRAP transporter permease [Geopsychrobacter electrodiphilus]